MLNVSIYSTGGSGINRNPNREDIINRIKKGKIENWKNKSEEEKAIIIQKVKEATNTPKAREKRSITSKAYYDSLTPEERKQSPETVEKRRKSLTGLKRTEETKAKMTLAHTGKKMSDETKKKLSESAKKRQASRSPEERKHTEESKLKISLKNKGKVFSEERRKEMSVAKKKFLSSMSEDELKKYRDNLYGSRKRKSVIALDL